MYISIFTYIYIYLSFYIYIYIYIYRQINIHTCIHSKPTHSTLYPGVPRGHIQFREPADNVPRV